MSDEALRAEERAFRNDMKKLHAMTNAQTEARAIVTAALPPHEQAILGHDAVTVLTDLITTALAAKNAELAAVRSERDAIVTAAVNRGLTLEAELAELREADGNFWEAIARAERAEAQLAEANRKIAEKDKALEPFAKLASEVDYLRHEDGSTSLHRLYARDLRAARRVLEAQGGENG